MNRCVRFATNRDGPQDAIPKMFSPSPACNCTHDVLVYVSGAPASLKTTVDGVPLAPVGESAATANQACARRFCHGVVATTPGLPVEAAIVEPSYLRSVGTAPPPCEAMNSSVEDAVPIRACDV